VLNLHRPTYQIEIKYHGKNAKVLLLLNVQEKGFLMQRKGGKFLLFDKHSDKYKDHNGWRCSSESVPPDLVESIFLKLDRALEYSKKVKHTLSVIPVPE